MATKKQNTGQGCLVPTLVLGTTHKPQNPCTSLPLVQGATTALSACSSSGVAFSLDKFMGIKNQKNPKGL